MLLALQLCVASSATACPARTHTQSIAKMSRVAAMPLLARSRDGNSRSRSAALRAHTHANFNPFLCAISVQSLLGALCAARAAHPTRRAHHWTSFRFAAHPSHLSPLCLCACSRAHLSGVARDSLWHSPPVSSSLCLHTFAVATMVSQVRFSERGAHLADIWFRYHATPRWARAKVNVLSVGGANNGRH